VCLPQGLAALRSLVSSLAGEALDAEGHPASSDGTFGPPARQL